ncbi:hypothetical protein SDC9_181269 [bioreactor metagenome]|uniref:Uncharacterized protein n=1 Tax=bioreactor metagenome TaxID=1076179 RepID=A0A645H442_9ZZZZ
MPDGFQGEEACHYFLALDPIQIDMDIRNKPYANAHQSPLKTLGRSGEPGIQALRQGIPDNIECKYGKSQN